MATDYNKFYQSSRHALGGPSQPFVDFFKAYTKEQVAVLDVGCGQGRDALFIARMGHHVTAIDAAPVGLRDIEQDAKQENLNITTVVADVCAYEWQGCYDVIVIDRTLHMLPREDRLAVLSRLLNVSSISGAVLIADEPSNMADFNAVFAEHTHRWTPSLEKKGYLFMLCDVHQSV